MIICLQHCYSFCIPNKTGQSFIALALYCQTKMLEINHAEVIVFNMQHTNLPYIWVIKNIPTEQIKDFEYLGINFQSSTSWKLQSAYVTLEAKKLPMQSPDAKAVRKTMMCLQQLNFSKLKYEVFCGMVHNNVLELKGVLSSSEFLALSQIYFSTLSLDESLWRPMYECNFLVQL